MNKRPLDIAKAQNDVIVKHLMHEYAEALSELSFGTPDVQVLETLDTEIL